MFQRNGDKPGFGIKTASYLPSSGLEYFNSQRYENDEPI